MENPVMFKTTTFGGFDKKAVISYIFELNESSKAAQEQLNKQLEEVGQSREALNQQLHEMEQRMQGIQAALDNTANELNSERQRSSELTNMLEQLNGEIKRQEEIIRQKDEKIQYYIRQNSELAEKAGDLELKKQEVENASAQIGKLLIDANADATRMVEGAKADAQRIVAEAEAQAANLSGAARQQADQVVADAMAQAQAHIEEANRSVDAAHFRFYQFRDEMVGVQQAVQEMAEQMQNKAQQIDQMLYSAESKLKETRKSAEVLEFVRDDEAPAEAQTEEAQAPAEEQASANDTDFFRVAAER